jgi:hypothetical protein
MIGSRHIAALAIAACGMRARQHYEVVVLGMGCQ